MSVVYKGGFPGAKHVDRLKGKQRGEFHMASTGMKS